MIKTATVNCNLRRAFEVISVKLTEHALKMSPLHSENRQLNSDVPGSTCSLTYPYQEVQVQVRSVPGIGRRCLETCLFLIDHNIFDFL